MKRILMVSSVAVLIAIALAVLFFYVLPHRPIWSVEQQIDAIGEVSMDSEDQIHLARAKYDALEVDQKRQVSNYYDLVTAEAKLEALRIDAFNSNK